MRVTRKRIVHIITLTVLLIFSCLNAWAEEYAETKEMFVDAGISEMFSSAHGMATFTITKGV